MRGTITHIHFVGRRVASETRVGRCGYRRNTLPFAGSCLLHPLFGTFLVSPGPFRTARTYVNYGGYRGIYPINGVAIASHPI